MRAEPLILADPSLVDATSKYITSPDMFRLDKSGLPIPSYTLAEVAKVFWASGTANLRRKVQRHHFVLSDDPECRHSGFAEDGYTCVLCQGIDWGNRYRKGTLASRYYSLASIERMAVVDATSGGLDGAQLIRISQQVRLNTQAWRYIP